MMIQDVGGVATCFSYGPPNPAGSVNYSQDTSGLWGRILRDTHLLKFCPDISIQPIPLAFVGLDWYW